MDKDIQVKRIKLEDGELDALIKSKWTEKSINFEILIREKNLLITANYEKEELDTKKYIKVSFDTLFKALSADESDEIYRFKIINDIFTIYKEESMVSSDDFSSYEVIYLRLPKMTSIELPKETIEIIASQMEDVAYLCKKYNSKESLLKICEIEIEKLNDLYVKLTREKEDYEKKVLLRCLELINEKKKFIRDKLMDVSRADESSFDIHEFILNDGLKGATSPKQEPEEYHKLDSPIACSSTSKAVTTPKSTQKVKRTPSKKLFAQISQPSDSDDSLDIVPLPKETSRKRKSENPDTSSIFKDFKMKTTPKKPKREEKESSVEAKKDYTASYQPENISESSEKIYSNPLNVFMSEDMCSQAVGFENLKSSQESIEEEGRNLRSKKKNPYSVDTMNILDM